MGPLPETGNGNKHVLVFVDKFTKYLEIFPVPDVQATTFCTCLAQYICRHSMPEKLLTDQGSAYESKVAEQLCELFDIEKLKTTPFHPQGNGQSENSNRTIVQLLRIFMDEGTEDNRWDELMPMFAFAHNISKHETTGEVSYETVYGRKPRIPLDLIVEVPETERTSGTFDPVNWTSTYRRSSAT